MPCGCLGLTWKGVTADDMCYHEVMGSNEWAKMHRVIESIKTGINDTGDACRLFHGRGHCYPGLEFITVDWFAPVVLVSLYSKPKAEWLLGFTDALLALSLDSGVDGSGVENIVLQHRYLPGAPSENIKGIVDGDYSATENGLNFRLNFQANQNVGFFLDMANCRQLLREKAVGKSVLNLFAYTCAFSVVATAAGARSVVNVDMAKGALNTGRLNHQINGVDTRSVSFFAHDIFKSWGKIRKYGPYDFIIVDPPTCQPGSFAATKDYLKIVKKLPVMLNRQGYVLACLNSPNVSFSFLQGLFSAVGGFDEGRVIAPPASFFEATVDRGLKTVLFQKSD